MKGKRRRTKGILTSLGKVPKSGKGKKKKESPAKKVLKGIGWAILGTVLLVLLIGTGYRFMRSSIGDQFRVEKVSVDRIETDVASFRLPEGAVAAAMVTLVRHEVPLPLTEEDLRKVQEGTELKVTYDYLALTDELDLIDWEVAPTEEPEDTEGAREVEEEPEPEQEPSTNP
jgi:hypothetical protein